MSSFASVRLGRIGIWRRYQPGPGIVPELEALGYGTLWLGSSPSLDDARAYLEASEEITIATGILNIWQHDPADVARQHLELSSAYPGSFLLGIGVGHPEATSDYTRPLTAMRKFFDGLDAGGVPREEMVAAALGPKMLDLAAERPVPRDERLIAAIGPKMLELAAQRTLGTHPYFTTVEHTRFAREKVGPDRLVAPEVAVVVDSDPDSGRAKAREYAALYLQLTNYTSNLLRYGFTERDLADGGSDRLIDAVIPHGSAEAVAEAVHAHIEAGADHVCLQPKGGDAVEDYRALAAALF